MRVLGVTQGVGFRPFVLRLAQAHQLNGWVQNDSAGLLIEIQGPSVCAQSFLLDLQSKPPPLARLDSVETTELPVDPHETVFVIRKTEEQSGISNPVTQDISVCADCLAELTSEEDRRYRYPFVNCTNCGPRFTIVEDIPYDRAATTMKSFQMCPRCQAEFDDPTDRRFHAQPNACPDCGPAVWFVPNTELPAQVTRRVSEEYAPRLRVGLPEDAAQRPSLSEGVCRGNDPIANCVEALRGGQIVCIKGIGGFHLVCDANNAEAVATLRQRKGRVDKPFAVMAASVDQAQQFATIDQSEGTLLESKEKPVVLLRKKTNTSHEPMLLSVAPGNDFVGVMLPYSPLHHLLVESISPLVATSGNVTDEPIARTNDEASTRLSQLADSFLFHDRDISAVCDDSVVRRVGRRWLPIRRSRGYAPMPIRLPDAGPSVLAVGGEIKSTFCVTKENYAYMSQHIGDVGNIETLEALQQNVDHFFRLFRVEVEAVAGDSHPDYLSSRWARRLATELKVPFIPIQHHFAHAMALQAEQSTEETSSILACCFDGTGYGTDGTIWGGEFMLAGDRDFQRLAHIRYFPLPGGDSSIKRPYRTALALLRHLGLDWDDRLPSVASCSSAERKLIRQQIDGDVSCARTSSMGRLFDAIASLIGARHEITYEAQAAMEMEAIAAKLIDDVDPDGYSFELRVGDTLEIGLDSVVHSVCEDVVRGVDQSRIAAMFHHSVAKMIGSVCDRTRQLTDLNRVGLTGGVFQNVLLLQLTEQALKAKGFEVLSHSIVPPNDGGLALGQAVVARRCLQQLPSGSVVADS